MRIKSSTLGILIFVLIFGGIFISSSLNLWETESSKVPTTYTSGEFAGEYNPEDIRGSYSFNDVSSAFSIPLDDLKRAFVLPDDTIVETFQNKNLETMYAYLMDSGKEIGNSSVKVFVALYKNLPIELSDDTYLPKQAVDIIINNNPNLSEEQLSYLESHSVNVSKSDTNFSNNEESESTKEENDDQMLVKGNTTFKEVLEWGVDKPYVEDLIGGQIPNPVMSLRDYCVKNEISFSTIKDTLQGKIDELNNN